MTVKKHGKSALTIREITVFAMLGTLMFVSKIIMECAPNIHFLGMLTVTYTLVYRRKALIPIYVYVLLNGIFAGFNLWWMPYLYIWTILWGMTMLIPKNLSVVPAAIICIAVCGLHGFLFGTLYAPAQALIFGFGFKTTLAWIAAGLPWDALHGLGNLTTGTLIVPLTVLLCKLEHKPLPFRQKT